MAASKKAPAVGIHLGTYACVGVWRYGQVEIIANLNGSRRTPSYVAFAPDELLIGDAAKNQIDMNPTNTIFGMNHLIGRHFSDTTVQKYTKLWPFKVVPGPGDNPKVVVKYKGTEKQFYPEKISSMVLAQMKEIAEIYLGSSVQSAVITVPAYFNDSQRQATRYAASIAGLKVVQIMDEPIAAAVTYGLEKSTGLFEDMFLVFDLGGSSFNVSVIKNNRGSFKVLANTGDSHLGGEDFHERLLIHFLKEFNTKFGKHISSDTRAIRRLRSASERAKWTLSLTTSATVEVPSLFEGIDFRWNISRARFEELNMDLFKRCMGLVTKCLKDAHMNKTSIHKVVLVGGSTRIPKVQQMLQEIFDEKVICNSMEPEEVVAYGAAIQAAKLRRHNNDGVHDLLVDVLPVKTLCTSRRIKGSERLSGQKIMGQSNRRYVHQEEYAIGIDFGTINSCVAVCQGNVVKIIENEYGSRLTGSDVTFTEIEKLIGASVNGQVFTNPATTIFNIKRLLGRCSDQLVYGNKRLQPFCVVHGRNNRAMVSVHYKGEDKNFAPEEIAAMVLSRMKEIAEAHVNSRITNAVICVPACFSGSQRKAIMDAGTIAGLCVIQLLNETTAAAIAYFLQNINTKSSGEKTLLIFGLGGGNLDVSIVTISARIIKVLAVVGDTNLGGEDFDNNMVRHFSEKFMKEKRRDIKNKSRSIKKLRAACEKAKRILSQYTQTTIEIDALDDGIDLNTTITREFFEELNTSLFLRCIESVEKCLRDANLDKNCIDEVVLVGGSTRIPKVQRLLQEFFNGKELCKSLDPDETVAYGAAVRAAILCGNKDMKMLSGLNIQDATSCSLWLEGIGGAMNLLIPESTPIPTKKELMFSTCLDNLTSITLKVHEYEFASSSEFTLSGFTPKRRGNLKVNVSFEVDHNCILNLVAKNKSNMENTDIKVCVENGLTKEELQKMVEAAARYKAEYEENKARAAALNSLENFAYRIKAMARDGGVSGSSKKLVEGAAQDAILWLETNYHASIDEISAWKKRLETIKSGIVYLGTNAS